MNQIYSFFVLVIFVLLFNRIHAEANVTNCGAQNNTDCERCLAAGSCGFCKATKQCYNLQVFNNPCGIGEAQIETCVGNAKIWIIIISVIAGIIGLTILILICCLCRKCKQCKIRGIERREQQDEQRMEERRAAAETRTAERNRVADQIRMKYGILKDNDNTTDYTRMN